MKTYIGKTALVTGGSSGIGLAIATRLSALGANIVLLARDPIKLEDASRQVMVARLENHQTVAAIALDVSDREAVEHVLGEYFRSHGGPDVLVNSAGITYPGLFEEMDLDIHRQNMEVNFFGTLYVTKAVVSSMKKKKAGHILNISSLVGMHGLYGYSAYGPSKFAVKGLSDSLRYELKPYGIHVSVAFPSDTQTPQLDFENQIKPPLLKALSESNSKVSSAEEVANSIIRGMEKNRMLIFPTPDAVFLFLLYCLAPGDLIYRVVDLLMAQARKKVAKYLAGK